MSCDLINISLRSESPEELPRDCHMSLDRYQNACLTMGELRDIMSQIDISWEFLQTKIDRASRPASPLDKVYRFMDPYSIGPGKSIRTLSSNVL